MEALIVIGSIMTYLMVAGATMVNFTNWRRRLCIRCGARGTGYCISDHGMSGFFAGIFFPLTLPVVLGTVVIPDLTNPDRLSRTEKRRQKELEEAEHKAELARVRAQETEALERSLRSL